MPQTYFTADTHFGHTNVIRFCNRPFTDAEEMDETLIANWNAVVGPKDDVFHLGDFAVRCDPKKMANIFRRLNGRKHLIIGNHDSGATIALPWSSQPAHYREISVEKQRIILLHYGMRVWNGMRYGALQFFGHSHGRLPGCRASLDVGVDSWGYTPVTLAAIRERLALFEPANPEVDPAGPGGALGAPSPRALEEWPSEDWLLELHEAWSGLCSGHLGIEEAVRQAGLTSVEELAAAAERAGLPPRDRFGSILDKNRGQ